MPRRQPWRHPWLQFNPLSNYSNGKPFYDRFMGRPVLSSYFVNMDCMDSLSICNKKLRELLDGVGWSNALNIAENAYPNLIKVFYSSMDASAEKQNWVITSVAGIQIEFDVVVLNSILETKDEGLELYSTRKELNSRDMPMLMLLGTSVGVLIYLMMYAIFNFLPSICVCKFEFCTAYSSMWSLLGAGMLTMWRVWMWHY